MAEYLSTRKVGDATITAIRDATDLWTPDWQAPEAEWRRAMPEAAARFPRARHLIQRAERMSDSAPEWASAPEKEQLGALERLGLLDVVEGDHDLAPGIDMLHAPGESPGHSVLRVRSAGEAFYCL